MYHKHFGLQEVPFSIKVNPNYLFMTDQHKDALAHLLYGTRAEGGFALLTGEVGTGKTTLIRALLQQLPEDIDIALVMNPAINAVELLATICDELGIEYTEREERLKALTDKLHAYLLEAYAQGRSAVVLIDEAQHLNFEALEQIRLLTNLETDTKKLLQIILVGQPEMDDMLRQPELRQLAQRITARFYLGPLGHAETATYIQHRLQVAGLADNKTLFPTHIVQQIYEQTEGIPRLINVLCDRILLGSYAKNSTAIDDDVVQQAVVEVFGTPQTRAKHAPRPTAADTHASNAFESGSWSENASPRFAALLSSLALLAVLAILFSRWNATPTLPISADAGKAIPLTAQEETAPIQQTVDGSTPLADSLEPGISLEPAASTEVKTPETTATSPAISEAGQDNNVGPMISADDVKTVDNDFWWRDGYATKSEALNTLLLQLELLSSEESVPCIAITAAELSCYEEKMEVWDDLLQINRVAVLQIRTPGRQLAYMPIVNMYSTDAVVLLRFGNTVRHKRVSLSDLGALWTGETTAIWQVPAGYTRPVGLRSSGAIVTWISDRFAELDGREDRLATKRFNEPLQQRVKLFQSSYGLDDDGMVGIHTLLKLSDASGLVTDLLLQTVDPEESGTP